MIVISWSLVGKWRLTTRTATTSSAFVCIVYRMQKDKRRKKREYEARDKKEKKKKKDQGTKHRCKKTKGEKKKNRAEGTKGRCKKTKKRIRSKGQKKKKKKKDLGTKGRYRRQNKKNCFIESCCLIQFLVNKKMILLVSLFFLVKPWSCGTSNFELMSFHGVYIYISIPSLSILSHQLPKYST